MFILKERYMDNAIIMDEWITGYDCDTFQDAVLILKKKLEKIPQTTILKDDERELIFRIDGNKFPIFGNLKNEPLLIVKSC